MESPLSGAMWLIEEGQVKEGMEMIRTEMKRDLDTSDVVSGYNNLCVGHLALKEYAKALEQCQTATKIRGNMWQSHNNMGNARLAMDDVVGAIANYQAALALKPDSATIQGNLALAQQYLAEDDAKKKAGK